MAAGQYPIARSPYPLCPSKEVVAEYFAKHEERLPFLNKKEIYTELAVRIGGKAASFESLEETIKVVLAKRPPQKMTVGIATLQHALLDLIIDLINGR